MNTPVTLLCDQAIFTSIRTPVGEGYRIVAASKGLRPDEKQGIVRSSPSHEALCQADSDPDEPSYGVAFYALPRDRLCVALSCFAGQEHTGRGGNRVYTHNVIFSFDDLARCGYNPFAVFRAMLDAGLGEPQLRPPAVLPELSLEIRNEHLTPAASNHFTELGRPWRCTMLNALLNGDPVVVNVAEDWLGIAEALFHGLPGPLRTRRSFSAGLRFSVGRLHSISLTHDDPRTIRSRTAGRKVQLIEPGDEQEPQSISNEWLAFVERHWRNGHMTALARRTSQNFRDVEFDGRERIGALYNDIDAAAQMNTTRLLTHVAQRLAWTAFAQGEAAEARLVREFCDIAQHTLVSRFRTSNWESVSEGWDELCELWRHSAKGAAFAQPVIEAAVAAAEHTHPLHAAVVVLDLVRSVPDFADRAAVESLVERTLGGAASWAQAASDADWDALTQREPEIIPALTRWRTVRMNVPAAERLLAHLPSGTTVRP